MKKILVVEDDASIHKLLTEILDSTGLYEVSSAYSGTEAVMLLEREDFDVMLLDLMLPGLTGEEVLEQSRVLHSGGVIILTAKGEVADKVNLLKLGADDYLTKPFDKDELLARIESLLRRLDHTYQPANTEEELAELTYKDLRIELDNYVAYYKDKNLKLTQTEFSLLQALMEKPDIVHTREKLYQDLWGHDTFVEENAINVHLSNLRKKIAKYAGDEAYIETVWGIGFKMVE